ncbi:putative polyketide synthase [Biscogniauxia marginata]|nr:putative polyketide synthase [Biscogniauxia marginata]
MDGVKPEALEPIAIVGIGCRMPRDVRCPTDLWKLLISQGIANKPKVPSSRFNIDAYLHPSNERPGSLNVSGGYFLEDELKDFDPGMFKISPVEALWMDPQQRKLLEVVYEALESSGTTLSDAAGRKTGCFVGSFTYDFQHMATKEPDFRHAYVSTGVDTGILGNRISYVFDLKGPSLTVNTACSSSLYTLDLACKAINSGECDSAIVGGTNLILTSHTFDESADGYARAEGVGALYLRPLSAALKAGDPIRAVIRSTATGSNGKCKDGLTHPSVEGQVEVIALAYKLGNMTPDLTSYIECHGTGTPVGDPIEVEAIHKALGASRPKSTPIEAASSMGTLIKAIMALENGVIPPTAGITKLSSSIPWDEYNVKVVRKITPFTNSTPIRRIGVNAFGYGGTNAHAILESVNSLVPGYRTHKSMHHAEGVPNGSNRKDPDTARPHLLLFSAHDKPTLKNNLADYSMSCNTADLIDLAYTLGLRRTKFPQRAFAVARKESLELDIKAASNNIFSEREPTVPAFIFTGQGAQWARMGASLLDMFPTALNTIRRLDERLSKLRVPTSWKIETMMTRKEESSLVNEPEYSQPLCTAVQIVLVELLAAWGVKPMAVIGHSSGEISAAYAAGKISAEDAITIAYFRGKVAASLTTDGAMLAVGIGAEEARKYIEEACFQGKVVVGCHNSPNNVTLSGDRDALEELGEIFNGQKIFVRVLKTGGKAYHSHHMKEAAVRYDAYLRAESIANVGSPSKIPMFSTVRAGLVIDQGVSIPDSYWADNLNSPVLFNQSVQHMLEKSPHINTLIETAKKGNVIYLPTLKRKEDDCEQMLRLAGTLWASDFPIDINAVTSVERVAANGSIEARHGSLLVDFPTYHWTYSKPCWTESRFSEEHRKAKEPRHDILGRRIIGTSALEPVWRNILRQKDLPWLAQHRVGEEVMLPAAGYLQLAIEAITQVNEQSDDPLTIQSYTIRDVAISAATVVPDDDVGTETLFHLLPLDGKPSISSNGLASQWYQFTSSCCSYGSWKETARGTIALNIKGSGRQDRPHRLPSTPQCDPHIEWLDKLRSVSFDLGPAFHHITNIYSSGETHTARGDLRISRNCSIMVNESRYVLHPTVLDACLQPFLVTVHQGRLEDLDCGSIPTHFGEVTIFPPTLEQLAEQCTVQIWIPQIGNRAYTSNSQLISHDGFLLADLSGCRHLLYGAALPQEMRGDLGRDYYLKIDWNIDIDYVARANEAGVLSDQPLATIVDLLLHKDVTMRTLCLDKSVLASILARRPTMSMAIAAPSKEIDILTSLYSENRALSVVIWDTDSLETTDVNGPYDLIITPEMKHDQRDVMEHIRKVIRENGRLLLRTSSDAPNEWHATLKSTGFSGIDEFLPEGIILTTAIDPNPTVNTTISSANNRITLVYRETPAPLLSVVSDRLAIDGWDICTQSIESIDSINGGQVILLADAEGPFLVQLQAKQLKGLINLMETSSAVTWVTCGGLLSGDKPEFGMTEGAARVIRNEKGSLDLVTLDFDTETTSNNSVADILADIATRQRVNGRNGETEYYLKGGVVHICRIVSHRDLNYEFVPKSGETITLHQRDRPAVQGKLEQGRLIFCRDDQRVSEPLGPDEVEVHVGAMGVSAADGDDDANFLSHAIAGIVTRVGTNVRDLSAGTKRTSSSLVQPLPPDSLLDEAASIPSSFITAMYGLDELARLQPGETVAIIDGMSEVSWAAVQLCHILKANPIIVTSTVAGERIGSVDGILSPDQIIYGHGDNISAQIHVKTAGRGVDVVFCPDTADETTIIECTHSVSPFARIITAGRAGGPTTAMSAQALRAKPISSFYFDIQSIVQRQPKAIIARILKACGQLYTDGQIQAPHRTIIRGSSEIYEALQSKKRDIGSSKHIVVYDENTVFKVLPLHRPLVFKNNVTYLMVGGLGGIGRQVSLYMAKRGAKHFAFVSRTGTDDPAAADTVQLLRDRGVEVVVLRANVLKKEEIAAAVAKINPAFPIRGVMNAAAVLRDATFRNMTIEAWKDVCDTKVKGCQNLHELLKDEPLDFFVMTGSITSTLGSSGQSNYGAANSFMDSLARHRRFRNLAAVTLDLPAILGVGLIHESPKLLQSIKSKGMYGIHWKEMLRAFEIAMTSRDSLPLGVDHIAVGIQPRPFGYAIKAAGAHVAWQEPRLNWLASAVKEQAGDVSEPGTTTSISESIMEAIQQAPSKEWAVDAVALYITRRLARLLMIEVESIHSTQKSVASHGLDSMIGAEFRNWIFREFKVEVPFQQLLEGGLTILELAKMLCEKAVV